MTNSSRGSNVNNNNNIQDEETETMVVTPSIKQEIGGAGPGSTSNVQSQPVQRAHGQREKSHGHILASVELPSASSRMASASMKLAPKVKLESGGTVSIEQHMPGRGGSVIVVTPPHIDLTKDPQVNAARERTSTTSPAIARINGMRPNPIPLLPARPTPSLPMPAPEVRPVSTSNTQSPASIPGNPLKRKAVGSV